MTTLRKLSADSKSSGVKRANSFTVDFSRLVIKPEHNIRYSEITDESVVDLVDAYKKGLPIPPIVVSIIDGQLLVQAGNRRHKALSQLQNLPEFQRVEIKEVSLSDSEAIAFMFGENSGKTLTPVDMSKGCRDLKNLGLDVHSIAELLNFSESKVQYYLVISNMSDEVKQAIEENKIAADLAAEIFRKKR